MIATSRRLDDDEVVARLTEHIDRASAAVLIHHGCDGREQELSRITPGAKQWTPTAIAREFDQHARQEARQHPGARQFEVRLLAADKVLVSCPYVRMGRLPDSMLIEQMSEGQRCAVVVDRLEASRTIVEIVQELRLSLKYVMSVHHDWQEAKKVPAAKPTTKGAKNTPPEAARDAR